MKHKNMVSQDQPNPNILHHFLIPSDPINNQTHFQTQDFNPYESILRPNNTYPESLGVFPSINIHSLGDRISRSVNLVQTDEPEMGHNNRHVMDLFGAPNESNRLSLSLSNEGLVPGLPYKQSYLIPGTQEESCCSEGIAYIGGECSYMGSTNNTFPQSEVPSYSRYLRPAQMLLEETANVGGRSVELSELRRLFLSGSRGATSTELKQELLTLTSSTSTDKHEIQIIISRLIALLEQVECRYDEYCNRMGELVSSFEVIAGEGSAKTYTALALQAMCRHFRSLREAILNQIKSARKKLSPELPKLRTGLSQLSLFDRESRQNRVSIQQIGLMQQCQRQAWRPIRGLPETSVAILRAWLFEHFLHPYPNDSEKLILASQTGLTKNQVSNWFINARVRLWKPMIEEMYKEEFGEESSPGDSDALFSTTCSSTRESLPDATTTTDD